MLLLEILFFASLFTILYVYVGYPVLVYTVAAIRRRGVRKGDIEPTVSILIAAHNEGGNIGRTLQNKIDLNYPKEKMEIIVVSDGSTDKTDDIVSGFHAHRVRLIRQEPRAGKTSALNQALPAASGEIIVFSDANSIYHPDAVLRLVQNFNDPLVGYATGRMVYTNRGGSLVGDGCSAYMKYENFLRKCESKIGSVVGVDGGVDAVRRGLYRPMSNDQLPDFVLPLMVVQQGCRVVYEPDAVLIEDALESSGDEYAMRVRVALRAFWALKDMKSVLNPVGNTVFAWQLWSHKVLRYLCFVFLIVCYASNSLLLSDGILYQLLFLLQNVFYLAGLLSPLLEQRGKSLRLVHMINYFLIVNTASAHAFLRFLHGEKQVVWTPRKGK